MKRFLALCAGLSFITTTYLFIAGILHSIFGFNGMIRIGHGSSWIALPEDTTGIFIVATMMLFVFLYFWGLAKFEVVTAWVQKNRVMAFLAGVLLIAAIMGGAFFIQSLDDDNIFLAVQNERFEVIEKLITNGVDINSKDSERNNGTALHDAVTWNSKEMVSFLLEKGANPNEVDIYNRTPLMVALLYREGTETEITEIVNELYGRANTDLSIKSSAGQTAYDIAVEKNYTTIAEILQKSQTQDARLKTPLTPSQN